MLTQPPPLTLEELALFNELFTAEFGLFFPEHKREILASRLSPRLRANHVQRFIDYYLMLKVDLQRELEPLICAITNNESYFFREMTQLEALKDDLIRQLYEGGPLPGRLRILSAGCSSGEEPYTLNIFLRSASNGFAADALTIDGVDIDRERIEQARSGLYRPTSLRVLDSEQVERYFIHHDAETYELRPRYRHGVRFSIGNILDLEKGKSVAYDAIFCRNVLIYFSEEAIKAAIACFTRIICPGGLLFLGHSESIIGLSHAFQVVRLGQCIAYRRMID